MTERTNGGSPLTEALERLFAEAGRREDALLQAVAAYEEAEEVRARLRELEEENRRLKELLVKARNTAAARASESMSTRLREALRE
ncbi:hypothetical protein [Paenibacillus mucilaginosus]|uniref:Uncharacterized protein n=2 Tax=Paenibacillus mucilaginosus TaxID=61624 RepID=H6NHP7_9BACL|nr:hypothetical protein [Paenibacillus mucilaginosus]AEI41071.1 hypothetical protein KNP414_02510 [Paenibacillus mucilaginosus KNP414]AFC29644.1 hypothetical protein PM3016_2768 [Paenibacillus mucilaginosus 3016]MCG7211486.1 hypothetical protein [Paenibacillus mucilaginosus]WDM30139.1 hypothetical protein KCX80_13760 [Paenibacillus mucilaginosus]WFA18326.1 hypothetical protein ERY13_14130 [Paenibacillus mucilaginosus]